MTKVNSEVRHARDIPASEFTVEDELLDRVAAIWSENFYTGDGDEVRVEPYKIHLYGPKGHFEVHRDTPENGLVGTFLLGLGDTTSYGGGLVVDGTTFPAHAGYWVAFFPDTPHKVEQISSGYRAVIAFKLFRSPHRLSRAGPPARGAAPASSPQIKQPVLELIGKMKAPFGIMLERKYCLGTAQLTGFDALLLESAHSLPNVEVHHLPVVLESSSNWGSRNEYNPWQEFEMDCWTRVYPFTSGHIDVLSTLHEQSSSFRRPPSDHTLCGAPWLENVEHVPFFSLNLRRSLEVYKDEEQETCNYVGNEAQAWRTDSVYLSYAILVLPNKVAP